MTLRRKMALAIGLTFVGLGSIVYSTLHTTLLRHFQNLEIQNTQRYTESAVNRLLNEINQIDFVAQDWAAIDDSYQFAQDGNLEFITANLNLLTLTRLELNLLFYFNADHQQMFGIALEPELLRKTDAPISLALHLTPDRLLDHPDLAHVRKGILAVPEGLLAISSRPIVTSEGLGPIQGSLVFGRYLDEKVLVDLSAALSVGTDLQMDLYSLDLGQAANLPADVQGVVQQLRKGDPPKVQPLNGEAIAGYALLSDIYGDANLLLRVTGERFIHQQGQMFSYYLGGSLLLVVVLSGAITYIFLDRWLLSRISRLSQGFRQIGATGDFSTPLTLSGNDELSSLSETINEVMAAFLYFQKRQLESEQRYRSVIEQALESIFLVDATTQRLAQANPAFERLLGYNSQQISSLTLGDLMIEDEGGLASYWASLREKGSLPRHELQYRRQDGTRIDIEVSVSQITYGRRQVWCFVAHDITDRKNAEADLRYHALHDSLTQLPNRAHFLAQLEAALADLALQHYVAVLFVDLDSFKVINDSLGHAVGDLLLQKVAKQLRGCLSAHDLVGRFGGDEFVVLLKDLIDPLTAHQKASHILETLKQPIHLDGRVGHTTASIGIALLQGSQVTQGAIQAAIALLRDADTAMYRAKAQGKGSYAVFDQQMHQLAMQRLQIEADLRLGMERHELRLFYQPIILMATQEIIGFEGLVRWQHPTQGLISPGVFLPIAEETGLIVEIDRWVLQQAQQQIQAWQATFSSLFNLTINVNLSGQQFSQPDFWPFLTDLLGGVSPHWLKFEITESLITQDHQVVATLLWQIRELGICLSIDDFGTGYSSLSRLHAFPIDTLKIDRSFISRIGRNGEHVAVVQGIIALAHSLGMDVVAEGVETPQQMNHLQELKCKFGQGYLFSRPVSGEAATALLNDQASRLVLSPLWPGDPERWG
ncbi:MAG: EAL domain-containing protein [Cyanobacteriota bacterium]|nr:EAL domain-containing protein [Cyanobacteriota bacterium]